MNHWDLTEKDYLNFNQEDFERILNLKQNDIDNFESLDEEKQIKIYSKIINKNLIYSRLKKTKKVKKLLIFEEKDECNPVCFDKDIHDNEIIIEYLTGKDCYDAFHFLLHYNPPESIKRELIISIIPLINFDNWYKNGYYDFHSTIDFICQNVEEEKIDEKIILICLRKQKQDGVKYQISSNYLRCTSHINFSDEFHQIVAEESLMIFSSLNKKYQTLKYYLIYLENRNKFDDECDESDVNLIEDDHQFIKILKQIISLKKRETIKIINENENENDIKLILTYFPRFYDKFENFTDNLIKVLLIKNINISHLPSSDFTKLVEKVIFF